MMKKIFLIALFTLSLQVLSAQHKITGVVTDQETGETLVGALVAIPDLNQGVATDEKGVYEIKQLKNGNYLIEVSLLGYKSEIKQLSITGNKVLDFQLSINHKELSEVVVTGVSRSTELKKTPIVVESIGMHSINQNSSTNLIDGLKNVPGVNQITTGASISKPIIRGLGYNRVITLNNGIRQEGQQWGDEHGIEIDEYSIGKVEIVKGPGSLMYGSDGIAGVLNFRPQKLPASGQIKSQVITNYQTNNQLLGYSVSNAGNIHGIQWLGRFSNKLAGNYENRYDGKVYNSGFREVDGSLFLGLNKHWGYSHLSLSTFNTSLGIIEGERDAEGHFVFVDANEEEQSATSQDLSGYKIGMPHQKISHNRVSSNNLFILNKGSIQADLGYQNNRRKEFANPSNPEEAELYFDLNTINYNIKYNFEKIKDWEISTGIGGMQQSNRNKGLEYLIPAYNLFDIGGFLFAQRTFHQLTVSGGLRFDNRHLNSKELYLNDEEQPSNSQDPNAELKFSPFVENYNGLSGSLGLSYQIDPVSTLKFNLSRGFRAPNIAELASNGNHEGSFRYEIGNPNLKSEISHQIDLAYLYDSDHITFHLSPFVNFIGNYIYSAKLNSVSGGDSIPNPIDPAPAFQFTSGNAILYGGEVYLDVHPHPLDWLHIENSFSFVEASQRNQADSLKYLPMIPAPKYRAGLKAEIKELNRTFSNGYIHLGLDHYFAQNKVFSAYGTETATPSYTLLSAGLGVDIKGMNGEKWLSLYLVGENLGDIAYQNHLSRLKYAPENPATGRTGVYNMGRNFSMKLIFDL